MDRAAVQRWVSDYERLWRTPGTDGLSEIFAEDVTYLPSPWAAPVVGLADLAAFWEAEREGAGEGFALTSEVLAVDDRTAVVRVEVDYERGEQWRDLWVLGHADDGRCRHFEEWPFSPDQPDGHPESR